MMRFILIAIIGIFIVACSKDKLRDPLDFSLDKALKRVSATGSTDFFILPESDDLAAVPAGVGNPLIPEKVALGKMLFFETGLALDARNESGMGCYSCSSCHIPSAGFMPGRVQGIADGGAGIGDNGEGRGRMAGYNEQDMDVQGVRPLSVLNVAYVTNSTWNGKFGANGVNVGTEDVWALDTLTQVNFLGFDGLEVQNIEGLKLHRLVVNEDVIDTLGYRPYFDAAFSDFPEEERYTFLTASFAISAYLRTLLTTKAPFQLWLKGQKSALSDKEKRGAILFFDDAGCYRCHKGPALNAMEFYALGVGDLYQTGEAFGGASDISRILGRGGFTGKEADLYKFKVPQLYNMKDSPFYFHGSSRRSLWGVVEYFNDAIPENPNVPKSQIAAQFKPLNLNIAEIQDIVAFLENGLRDPDLERYKPDFVLSGNCFPNNDPRSRSELGCD